MSHRIALEHVHKRFGPLVVLDDVSLEIPLQQTTAIIGPSGTGKSVLLKHLVGLLAPDAGDVWVLGTNMAVARETEKQAVRRRLGMLFQEGALFDSLSVGENVEFPLLHQRRDWTPTRRRERVREVLAQVELPGIEERATAALSGGQRKRVGLARAIVAEPELVLFDEPNSGLDPITSSAIDALIVRMKRELGVTFVVISHDIVGTLAVADHLGMLHQGRLLAWGPTDAVVRSDDPLVRAFLSRNVVLPTAPDEVTRLPTAEEARAGFDGREGGR